MLPLDTPVLLEYQPHSGHVNPELIHLLPRRIERDGERLVLRDTREQDLPDKLSHRAGCGQHGWLYLYNGLLLDYTHSSLCNVCAALNPHLQGAPAWTASTANDCA